MSDQTPTPSAGAAPTPAPAPEVDHAARAAELEAKLREFQTREGRFRNEKGVMQARIRELEQLALGSPNSTGQPDYGQPSYTEAPPYQPTYSQPQPPPPQADIVTRDEFDLYRFQRDHNDRFEAVRQIALDANKVGNFIRYRVDAWGRPVIGADGRVMGDIYATYSAIADHLEKEELKAKLAQNSPTRNPALGTISGTSASASEEQIDLANLTPEQMREKFPEAFSPTDTNSFWGK